MATPRSVATEIRQVFEALLDLGIVIYTNSVLESPQRVSWTTPADHAEFLLTRDDLSIDGYLHWLESNHFSALLFDGSLMQITYDFNGHEIVGHRLAYIPCPVSLANKASRDLLDQGEPWGDVIRMQLTNVGNVMMKSALRFDYDPVNANDSHPAAHFTMNTTECRIACVTPFRVGRFLDFIFRTFYQDLYSSNAYLRGFVVDGWFSTTFLPSDTSALHLSWSS